MVQRVVIVVSAILLVHVIIGAGSLFFRSASKNNHIELMTELEQKWWIEDDDRKAYQEKQLQEEFGTSKLDRIVFDPRLDVRLAYQKLFDATMSDYLVEVEVDRFDEVYVFVNTFSAQETYRLTMHLKESMPYIEPEYIYEIVFTDGDHFHIVGKSQLMKINDWSSAKKRDIEKYCFPKKK
jgi:hypothetical protein